MSEKVKNHQFLIRVVGGSLAPLMILLSDYRENYLLLIILVVSYLALNTFIRYATISGDLSNRIYRNMLFFDVLMISLAIGARGGIRSDFYLGYFLILGYAMVVPEKSLLMKLSGWITLSYVGVTYLTSEPDTFNFGRLFIRLSLLIGTSILLRLFVDEMIEYKEKHANAMNMALRDSMTNTYNRRMLSYMKEETDLTKHSHIAMIDLDDFKLVNDTYGHSSGDRVLIDLVKTIDKHIKPQDICIRYGGEEFMIFFYNASTTDAKLTLDTIRKDFSQRTYTWYKASNPITFTAGLTLSNTKLGLAQEISQADVALYHGKSYGKNCTINYQDLQNQSLSPNGY